MPDAAFPPVHELLPHSGDAVLLDAVVAHDERTTTCVVVAGASPWLRAADGSVPGHLALEYMAQAVAAHGGLLDRATGREARPGFFLGSRRLSLAADRFAAGQRLLVRATHARGGGPMLAFDCDVRDESGGEALAAGVLTVYLLESFEALSRDFQAGEGDA